MPVPKFLSHCRIFADIHSNSMDTINRSNYQMILGICMCILIYTYIYIYIYIYIHISIYWWSSGLFRFGWSSIIGFFVSLWHGDLIKLVMIVPGMYFPSNIFILHDTCRKPIHNHTKSSWHQSHYPPLKICIDVQQPTMKVDIGGSIHGATPKSSIWMGFSTQNTILFYPPLWKPSYHVPKGKPWEFLVILVSHRLSTLSLGPLRWVPRFLHQLIQTVASDVKSGRICWWNIAVKYGAQEIWWLNMTRIIMSTPFRE